mmetsp:Transcript_2098/g.5131  ORF Transcript_2098/g.5131 Transcript_2098/m.5131 type:complete len:847 (-) Transcript_2098:33-2573(-)
MSVISLLLRGRRSGRKSRASQESENADVELGGGQGLRITDNQLDTNHDGKISPREMLQALHCVSVRADIMVSRLKIERDIKSMCFKVPLFIVCLTCLLLALFEFLPPEPVRIVHQALSDHFDMANVKSIHRIDDVYAYMLKFGKLNYELQPVSANYWCESRYITYQWNETIQRPVRACPSPRMYVLGASDTAAQWTNATVATGAATSCVDNNTMLQVAVGDATATCGENPSYWCAEYIGFQYCKQTCGYCAPFTYERLQKFKLAQLVLVPAAVYQTRFGTSNCQGFAHTFNMQSYSPLLETLMPGYDGPKSGSILTCIDREKHSDDPYAHVLPCPVGAPTEFDPHGFCDNGFYYDTPKASFHGMTVYPDYLVYPEETLSKMKAVEWIDLLTDTVTVSTMVYTQGVEIFTSVSVNFKIDLAGNIHAQPHVVSYRDLIGKSRSTFIVCLVLCMVCGLIGVIISVRQLVLHPSECHWGSEIFQLLCWAIFVLYPAALLFSWSRQLPMADEYMTILNTVLSFPGDLSEQFFGVKSHIYSEIVWLQNQQKAVFVMCYMEFILAIMLLAKHPRMAVLSQTVVKASDGALHFAMIFVALFVLLGVVAHWQLASVAPQYGSFGRTLEETGTVLLSSSDSIDKDSLHGSLRPIYWIYTITFMVVILWALLNFFLGVVLEAYSEVMKEIEECVAEQSLWADLCDLPRRVVAYRRHGWPSPGHLEAFFDEAVQARDQQRQNQTLWFSRLNRDVARLGPSNEDDAPKCNATVTAADLKKAFPQEFAVDMQVAEFICHYLQKVPNDLLCMAVDDSAANQQPSKNPVVQALSGALQEDSVTPAFVQVMPGEPVKEQASPK